MWTDGRTDTKKLIDAYREYENALSNAVSIKRSMDGEKNQNKIGQTASSLATNTMFIPGRFKCFGERGMEGRAQSFAWAFIPSTNREEPIER